MFVRILTTLLLALALIACDKKENAPKATAHDHVEKKDGHEGHKHEHAENKGGHAPADAVPGSHEDWCSGHGVAESQCTRCNPSLIAGFKATKDWCDTHQLPKSQCLACNPKLVIKRPAKTAK